MNKLVVVILIIFATNNLYPQNYFIENRGQWKPTVRFVGQSAGYNVIVTDNDILIDVPDYSTVIKDSIQNRSKHSGCVYRLQILSDGSEKLMITNSNEIRGVNKQTTYFNYFTGNDSSKWFTRVPSFRALEFKGSDRDASFSLEMSGKKLLLCSTNEAAHITGIQLVSEKILPVPFTKTLKSNSYTLDINKISGISNKEIKDENDKIQWDEHDDRNLVYSTYFGGAGDMYVDREGYCYLTGSVDEHFPTTPGAYKEEIDAGTNSGFVSKLSPDGKDLLYSTYLCGEDAGSSLSSIKCDKNNNIYVGGEILSNWDYPVTENALQKTGNGHGDFIITKLDPTGTKLLYSTYLGGEEYEEGDFIFVEVDDKENIYLAGITRSKDYPVSENCLKDTISGAKDIVITKINTITGKLVYSTFLGGRGESEHVRDIYLDSGACIYLCGGHVLDDFPVTEGVFKDYIEPGKSSAFISKLNENGDSLIFSSFFGGNYLTTVILSLDIAEKGNIFIVGITRSKDFPVTSEDIGLRPQLYTQLEATAYITELDPKCSYIVHSTCINNKDIIQGSSLGPYNIAYDGKCAWISGSNVFWGGIIEATEGAFQKNGEYFFMKVSSDFRKILYLSYIEDCHNEYEDILHNITDMDIINGSLLYLYGTTNNLNFPTSPDSFQPDYTEGVGARAFIMKFDMTTVSVGEEQRTVDNELINIYPNPASDYIEINLGRWTPSVRWSPSDLTIYNSLGECVLAPLAFGEGPGVRLDISALSPGLYFISINNGNQTLTGSFIVLR